MPSTIATAKSFRLLRYFSLASLAGIIVVTGVLTWTYRELTESQLIDHESRTNADLAAAFANFVGRAHGDYIVDPAPRDREALLADPRLPALREDVLTHFRGLQVAKLKIYNLDGLTIFSTDARQIGEDKSRNIGFLGARDGRVSSALTFRDRFDAFEGVIANRTLIASYVPYRHFGAGRIEGVLEIYSDVTDLLQRKREAQWRITGLVLAILAALYGFLHVVVRRADRLIQSQEAERAVRESAIRHEAYHDRLTGLPNRASFSEQLDAQISASVTDGCGFALLFIDLDRFKLVNDSLGHAAGDHLLEIVATRLRSALRDDDMLFRMGGDEFTAILRCIESANDADSAAQRAIRAVGAPVNVGDHEFSVGATIGIAIYPSDGPDAASILRNADAAMYAAKGAGRGTHLFYQLAMNDRAVNQLDLESALQAGFRQGEFALVYQPRVDARTRRIAAAEALLRWRRPQHGLVPPSEFLDVLEDMGLMPAVGEWVMVQACRQLRHWMDAGLRELRVSVNVSASQFRRPDFEGSVRRALELTGIPARCLEIEITESLLMSEPEQSRERVAALKRLGIRMSIDDFGTGYSSLNYLRNYDFDYLKIDRSFIGGLAHNARDRAVVAAIADLAKALDLDLVAEGVETEEQAAFFLAVECAELQGFLFSPPTDAIGVEQLVRAAMPSVAAIAS